MHIALTATLPAVTIRKEHIPEPGNFRGAAPQPDTLFFVCYCHLQYIQKVCIESDCGTHLNGTEVWLCLTDSNASQMDPITCLIVATSCLPFFFFFFFGQCTSLQPCKPDETILSVLPGLPLYSRILNWRLQLFLPCNNVKLIRKLYVAVCAFVQAYLFKKKRQC